MAKVYNSKATPTKRTGAKAGINYDYDYNTEFGDGDIPDIDKPGYTMSKSYTDDDFDEFDDYYTD